MSELDNLGIHIRIKGESNVEPVLDIAVRCSCGASVIGMFTTGTVDQAIHAFMSSHDDDCPIGTVTLPALDGEAFEFDTEPQNTEAP